MQASFNIRLCGGSLSALDELDFFNAFALTVPPFSAAPHESLISLGGLLMIQYLQLQPESTLSDISALSPFRAIVIIEETVTSEWQEQVSDWLVRSGCLFMMAWGEDCSSWDTSVDLANCEEFEYGDIPEEKFVMTTWHENEPLKEVFWFSKNNAFHPTVEINDTLLLHISQENKEKEFLEEWLD